MLVQSSKLLIRNALKIRLKLSSLISLLVINLALTWPWSTLIKESPTYMFLLILSLMPVCLVLSVMAARCGTKTISFKTLNAVFPIDHTLEFTKPLSITADRTDNLM